MNLAWHEFTRYWMCCGVMWCHVKMAAVNWLHSLFIISCLNIAPNMLTSGWDQDSVQVSEGVRNCYQVPRTIQWWYMPYDMVYYYAGSVAAIKGWTQHWCWDKIAVSMYLVDIRRPTMCQDNTVHTRVVWVQSWTRLHSRAIFLYCLLDLLPSVLGLVSAKLGCWPCKKFCVCTVNVCIIF